MKQLLLALFLLTSLATQAQTEDWTFALPISDLNGVMDVAADDEGNAYLTGRFTGSLQLGSTHLTSPGLCLYVAKCDARGKVLQLTKLEGASDVLPSGIAVDKAGNAYVTGTFRGTLTYNQGRETTAQLSQTGTAAFTLKCRPNGTVDWIRQGVGSTDSKMGAASGSGIAVDPAGNSYVTGTASGANVQFGTLAFGARYQQAFAASYSPQGALRWARVWNGLAPNDGSSSQGGGVAVNSAGDCYVSGTYATGLALDGSTLQSAGFGYHLFLARLDTRQGQVLWTRGPAGDGDGRGVATDKKGNAYLVGNFEGTAAFGSTTLTSAGGSVDGFVARYSPQGNVKWATAVGGADYDVANDIAVNPKSGQAYVTGMLNFTSQNTNQAFLTQLSRRGRVRQQELVGGPGTSTGAELAVDDKNNIYTAGIFTQHCDFGPISLTSAVTQCYFGRFGSLFAHHKEVRAPLALSIFPNPAQSQFTLRLTGTDQATRATLYDHLGHAVAVQALPAAPIADVDAAFDTAALPNGLYMLRLESGKEITTRMVSVQH